MKAGAAGWLTAGPAAWFARRARDLRRVYSRLGPRNTALAGGTAAAATAAVIAGTLMSNEPPHAPQ